MKLISQIAATVGAVSCLALVSPAMAADCATTVESNDAMQFNVKSIAVPKSCKTFAITLKHVGKLPVAAMGHNLVIAAANDLSAVASDGIAAGLGNDYLKAGDKRVIAHTKMLGGGMSDTLQLQTDQLKAGTAYSFFCSFPGHSALMKGALTLSN
ncbi:azurin [Pseudorhodoferax soli]|uniref:Azurin n=1 Tax=Pseudorhodoferax soli TaxID=545864 RepID=A0A368XNM7_9BURK|nr:azurin [Pseudorhodoferax soli]RCW68618.1 azurin [Pseudorhodoferax soli]